METGTSPGLPAESKLALKRGRTRRTRIVSFALALASFLYILAVAVTRNPFPGLSG